jgi:hypothetical protein
MSEEMLEKIKTITTAEKCEKWDGRIVIPSAAGTRNMALYPFLTWLASATRRTCDNPKQTPMQGVYSLHMENEKRLLVSTDGIRMHFLILPSRYDEGFPDNVAMKVKVTKKEVVCEGSIDGHFPNFASVIPAYEQVEPLSIEFDRPFPQGTGADTAVVTPLFTLYTAGVPITPSYIEALYTACDVWHVYLPAVNKAAVFTGQRGRGEEVIQLAAVIMPRYGGDINLRERLYAERVKRLDNVKTETAVEDAAAS